jgi:hypothetical protein
MVRAYSLITRYENKNRTKALNARNANVFHRYFRRDKHARIR